MTLSNRDNTGRADRLLDELQEVARQLRFLLERYDRRLSPYGDGKDELNIHSYGRGVHARQQRGQHR